MKQNNWQDTLIDLVLLENEQCPKEQNCYINNILSFVEAEINRQLAEERKRIKDLITKEIVIAQKEGTPTSRLTSLFNNLT